MTDPTPAPPATPATAGDEPGERPTTSAHGCGCELWQREHTCRDAERFDPADHL